MIGYRRGKGALTPEMDDLPLIFGLIPLKLNASVKLLQIVSSATESNVIYLDRRGVVALVGKGQLVFARFVL